MKRDMSIYNVYMRVRLDNKDPVLPSEAFEEINVKQLTPNRVSLQLSCNISINK